MLRRAVELDRIEVVHLRRIDQPEVPLREALDATTRAMIVGASNLYNVAQGDRRLGKLPGLATAGQDEIIDLCAANGMAFLPFFLLAIPGPPRVNEALMRIARGRGGTSMTRRAFARGRHCPLPPRPSASTRSAGS